MAKTSTHTATTRTGAVATRRSAHTYTHAMVIAFPLAYELTELDETIDSLARRATQPNAEAAAYAQRKLDAFAPERAALVARIAAGETHEHAVMSWHSTRELAERRLSSDLGRFVRQDREFFGYVVEVERS